MFGYLRGRKLGWLGSAAVLAPLLVTVAAGCGDDEGDDGTGGTAGTAGTAGSGGTGGSGGTAGTGGSGGDAGPDGGVAAVQAPIELAGNESDRLTAVAIDDQGRIYAAGYVTEDVQVDGGDAGSAKQRKFALARLLRTGGLDTTFGTGGRGFVTADITAGSTLVSVNAIALQPGAADAGAAGAKILVGGMVDSATPGDVDVAVVRFNLDGSVDDTFGEAGLFKRSFGDAAASSNARDLLYDIEVDASGRVVLFGSASTGRDDVDRLVARLTPGGELDTQFSGDGYYTVDVVPAATENDTGRNGIIQSDGKIVASGYSNVAGQNQIVLIRLNDDGTPDTNFSEDGVMQVAALPAPGMAEAYAVAQQSTGRYITTGYGRVGAGASDAGPADDLDVVSFSFSAAGQPDTGWGTDGQFIYDRNSFEDRGRNLILLPENRVLIVGSTSEVDRELDALALVVNEDGTANAAFGADGRKYSFGRGSEAFYGVALSPDKTWAVAVGWRAGVAAGDAGIGADSDDDGVMAVIPLQ